MEQGDCGSCQAEERVAPADRRPRATQCGPATSNGRSDLPPDAAELRDEHVVRALCRLDEDGELTARQRAAVERFADRLVGELLAMFESDGTGSTGSNDDRLASPLAER